VDRVLGGALRGAVRAYQPVIVLVGVGPPGERRVVQSFDRKSESATIRFCPPRLRLTLPLGCEASRQRLARLDTVAHNRDRCKHILLSPAPAIVPSPTSMLTQKNH
jgi:hypothetical protein